MPRALRALAMTGGEALMANFQWRKIRARCPYYIASWDKGIRCEGIEEGQNSIRVSFRLEAGAADWFDRFCARRYTQCPIYQLHEEAEETGN